MDVKAAAVRYVLSKADPLTAVKIVKSFCLLDEEVTKIIADHRKEHGEPPAPMMAVYEYLHEKHIDKLNRIKTYQMQYRA